MSDGLTFDMLGAAIASLIGCGALCMAAVVVGLVAIAIVRWL